MDPNTGRLYHQSEVDEMKPDDRRRLIEMRGRQEDVEAVSRAVKIVTSGYLTPKEIRQGAKDARRAKNRVARKQRKTNKRRGK